MRRCGRNIQAIHPDLYWQYSFLRSAPETNIVYHTAPSASIERLTLFRRISHLEFVSVHKSKRLRNRYPVIVHTTVYPAVVIFYFNIRLRSTCRQKLCYGSKMRLCISILHIHLCRGKLCCLATNGNLIVCACVDMNCPRC